MNSRMLLRLTRFAIVAGLLGALWVLNWMLPNDQRSWVHPAGTARGPVKILQFYANVGTLTRGEKAMLCYGVENAKSVHISPMIQGVYPSPSRCLEIVPEHTTHYTLLAEGYDGRVAMQSFTLPVETVPLPPQQILPVA